MKRIHFFFMLLTAISAFTCFYLAAYSLSRTSSREKVFSKIHEFWLKQESIADSNNSQITLKIGGKIEQFAFKVFQSTVGGNKAIILNKTCPQSKSLPDESKVELITGFVDLVRNSNYRKILGDLTRLSDMPENLIVEAREMEVINVLQVNLLHPMLENIHVLVWSRETANYLKSLNLTNSEKLVIRVVGRDVGLKEQLLYASECLRERVVAITNHDNTIGKGWDNKSYLKILKEKDIMYALTRHSTLTERPDQGSNCKWNQGKENNCDIGGFYTGSHDTFILQARKWNNAFINDLNDVTPDKLGMENLFLWHFHTKLHYSILNPCQVLFVHHHHCVPLRGINRPRINVGGKSFTVGYSNKFE